MNSLRFSSGQEEYSGGGVNRRPLFSRRTSTMSRKGEKFLNADWKYACAMLIA